MKATTLASRQKQSSRGGGWTLTAPAGAQHWCQEGVARGTTHMCRLFQRLNGSGPVSPSHQLVQRVERRSHGGLPGQLEACRGTGSQGETGSGRGCHVGSRLGGGSRWFCPCLVPSRLSQVSGEGRAWPAHPGGRAGKASLQNRVDSGEPSGSEARALMDTCQAPRLLRGGRVRLARVGRSHRGPWASQLEQAGPLSGCAADEPRDWPRGKGRGCGLVGCG